jgi:hypothetical protein
LDETQFNDAKIMFAEKGKLFVILATGNLYEVQLGGTK